MPETQISPPLPLTWRPPYQTGRFYEACEAFWSGPTGTNTESDFVMCPMWVPNSAVLVNMGIEVTSTGTGAHAVLGIYDSLTVWDKKLRQLTQRCIPDLLVCEVDINVTSAAYLNGAVTYRNGYTRLPQGLCWAAYGPYTTSTVATVRKVGGSLPTLSCPWMGAGWRNHSGSGAGGDQAWRNYYAPMNMPALSLLNTGGKMPLRFQFSSMSGNDWHWRVNGSAGMPRIMLEF